MEALEAAVCDGVITCSCGNSIEPDCDKCIECGSINPLVDLGFI